MFATLPRQAGVLGVVPDAQDPRPGLSAGLWGGEGGAAGRGVHEDVAEQQAVEATEHVHDTGTQEQRDDVGGPRQPEAPPAPTPPSQIKTKQENPECVCGLRSRTMASAPGLVYQQSSVQVRVCVCAGAQLEGADG